jgi:hypothetical protein
VSTLSQQAIDAACERFGHKLGWRFLTSPEHNFQTARVALVTINPGGAVYEPPQWSVENGSAYVVESWKGRQPGTEKLQSQVRRMFKLADVAPEDVLSGYFVPFRSPTWSALARKSESLHFAERLWREAFRRAENLQIVIAFGKDVAAYVAPLLDAREMKRSYLDYAMSVIVSRALPDVRDGLKPVHRRILYAMHERLRRRTSPIASRRASSAT